MFKLFLCLAVLSTSVFADSRKLSGREAHNTIKMISDDLSVYFAEKNPSNCSLVGSKVRARFVVNGKNLKNDLHLKNRSGVDLSVAVDEASSTVSIEQGLLFTSDVVNVKYVDNKISEVEMVVALGSEIQTIVKCN